MCEIYTQSLADEIRKTRDETVSYVEEFCYLCLTAVIRLHNQSKINELEMLLTLYNTGSCPLCEFVEQAVKIVGEQSELLECKQRIIGGYSMNIKSTKVMNDTMYKKAKKSILNLIALAKLEETLEGDFLKEVSRFGEVVVDVENTYILSTGLCCMSDYFSGIINSLEELPNGFYTDVCSSFFVAMAQSKLGEYFLNSYKLVDSDYEEWEANVGNIKIWNAYDTLACMRLITDKRPTVMGIHSAITAMS